MRNHIILLLLFTCVTVSAQRYTNDRKGFCGTEVPERFIEEMKSIAPALEKYDRHQMRTPVTDYPVTVHLIRKSDGTGGIDVDSFLSAMDQVNQLLAPSNVALTICGDINFIDNDQYYEFYKPDENSLYYSTRIENTMNLYIANSVTYGSGATRCGYAYFPGWKDMIMMDRHCTLDSSTFVHEVGHYFGLYHTHGNEVNDTEELVDQSNCMITGDDVCDTPADPLLTWTVDSATCVYNGSAVDDNGEPFVPDPANIMSYAPKHCKMGLSSGQYNRISYVANFLRDYLTCEQLSANFDLDKEVGLCGDSHIVNCNYTGIAEGLDMMWDIDDDGMADGDTSVAQFTFTVPGKHDICLMTMSDGDTVHQCKSFTMLGSASGPHAVDISNPADFAMINPDKEQGWNVVALDSANPEVLVMDNFHYNASDIEDHVVICPIDISEMSVPALEFDMAYVPFNASRSDALRVDVSTDCGTTWVEVFYGEGVDISSTGGYSAGQWQPYFVQDWQHKIISLDQFNDGVVLIRLTNITGHGNYLYVKQLAVTDNDPLPVRFITLEAFEDTNGEHVISWSTADEEGATRYIVERSVRDLDFMAVGSTDPRHEAVNNYRLRLPGTDELALYRVRVENEDGSSEFSPIRSLKPGNNFRFELYPNPTYDQITVRGLELTGDDAYSVYELTGRKLFTGVLSSSEIDVSSLNAGVYAISVNGQVQRFVKLAR